MISLARDLCTYKAEGLLQGEAKELLVGKKISYFVVLVCLKMRKVNKRSSTAVIKKVPQWSVHRSANPFFKFSVPC